MEIPDEIREAVRAQLERHGKRDGEAGCLLWTGSYRESKNGSGIDKNHLFPGSHEDNMRDCSKKGRIRTGTRKGVSCYKLTSDQVADIRKRRAAGESGVKLGLEFGVHYSQIYRIANLKRRVLR